jgi:hypothetical protein
MPTCVGYTLTLKRASGMTVCELFVDGDDNEVHRLQVLKSADRKALVQKTVAKLAEVWPSATFQFESNAAKVITKIL